MKPIKILFVATSHDKIGESARKTGVWLEELSAPYYVFKDAGIDLTIASPLGGPVPLDPQSQSILVITRSAKRFLKDEEAMKFLAYSITLEEVKSADYDAVFITGGHGAMWDLGENGILKQLLESFNREKKPVGAICHGVVGLLSLQNDQEELLVKGKKLTGFSNSEEKSTGLGDVMPFLLETKLFSIGALYSKGNDYLNHVVTDGNIVTGQNPASAEEAAKRIVALATQNRQQAVYYNLALNN